MALISVGIGAFLTGIAFGYTLQIWQVNRVNSVELDAKFEEGRLYERTLLGRAEGQEDCYANGQIFQVGQGQVFTQCASGANGFIELVTNDKLVRGTIGASEFQNRPPASVPFGSTNCVLVVSGVTEEDEPKAVLSFQCS
ncbi:MAG: hypothetical protein AAGA15_10975 [Pseudomonadota bacterium]